MDEKLVFRAGVQAGKEFPLGDEEITIGREMENNIVLDDVQISRKHTKIYRQNNDFFIEDMKSTNGTVLNGKTLKKPQKLKNGDVVAIGENNVFEIQIPSAAAAKEESSDKQTDKAEQAEMPAKSPKRKFLKLNKREKRPKEVEELLENAQEKQQQKPQEEIEVEPQQELKQKQSIAEKYPKWAIILMIAIGFIIVFCVIPWVVVEVTDQWCNLFSGFFNSLNPNACP